jgi:mono/diheme cytochrome c family protein
MRLLHAVVTPLLLAAGSALAADDGVDVSRGHELAKAWCTQCHAVERGQLVGPFADIPSFVAVARQTSTTGPALHAFLTTPHGDMPDVKLTPSQLGDLIAYILSLRDR